MRTFFIKKGKHSSSRYLTNWLRLPHFGITFKKKITYECSFDTSCIYSIRNNDDLDINKLLGFSTKYNHHIQSARIGWTCEDGKHINLYTYTYSNSKRLESKLLGQVFPNELFTCSIEDVENSYVYKFTSARFDITVAEPKSKDWFLFNYRLYPFFGGNNRAPHDMKFKLRKV